MDSGLYKQVHAKGTLEKALGDLDMDGVMSALSSPDLPQSLQDKTATIIDYINAYKKFQTTKQPSNKQLREWKNTSSTIEKAEGGNASVLDMVVAGSALSCMKERAKDPDIEEDESAVGSGGIFCA